MKWPRRASPLRAELHVPGPLPGRGRACSPCSSSWGSRWPGFRAVAPGSVAGKPRSRSACWAARRRSWSASASGAVPPRTSRTSGAEPLHLARGRAHPARGRRRRRRADEAMASGDPSRAPARCHRHRGQHDLLRSLHAIAAPSRTANATRDMILTLPRVPAATEVPRSSVPKPDADGFFATITMGWLVDGAASGRIPKPEHPSAGEDRDRHAATLVHAGLRRSSGRQVRPDVPGRTCFTCERANTSGSASTRVSLASCRWRRSSAACCASTSSPPGWTYTAIRPVTFVVRSTATHDPGTVCVEPSCVRGPAVRLTGAGCCTPSDGRGARGTGSDSATATSPCRRIAPRCRASPPNPTGTGSEAAATAEGRARPSHQ